MSIETTLTLGLTAAILVAAFVLRVVILGSLRLGLRLAGRDTSWTRPQVATGSAAPDVSDARVRRKNRPLWRAGTAAALRRRTVGIATALRSVAQGAGGRPRTEAHGSQAGTRSSLGAVGASLLAMTAAGWTALTRGAASLERWAERTSESLEPAMRDITTGARRAFSDMGKYVVAGIATVQHVVLLIAGWLRGLWTHARSGSESSPRTDREPRKVIELDKDLEDDPVGPTHPRSRITV